MRASLVVAVCLSALTGCTTTRASRDQATELAQRVAVYQEEQHKRIEDLNRRYRRSQARLMESLARYNEHELRQAMDVDAQKSADLILADWEALTLPDRFRDVFEKNVVAQRAKLEELDRRLADARAAYAEAYKEARLDLAHLESVRSSLIALSEADRARDLSQLVTLVTKIYQCLRAERAESAAAPPATGGAATTAASEPKEECR